MLDIVKGLVCVKYRLQRQCFFSRSLHIPKNKKCRFSRSLRIVNFEQCCFSGIYTFVNAGNAVSTGSRPLSIIGSMLFHENSRFLFLLFYLNFTIPESNTKYRNPVGFRPFLLSLTFNMTGVCQMRFIGWTPRPTAKWITIKTESRKSNPALFLFANVWKLPWGFVRFLERFSKWLRGVLYVFFEKLKKIFCGYWPYLFSRNLLLIRLP